MFKRARSRLTYANVASTFALGVALTTGGAYAANEWTGENIVDQSLTAADLAIGTIGTLRIADESVQAVDIAPGAVTSSEVADDSLTQADLGVSSVSGSEILNNSVGSADIAFESLTSTDIADDAVGPTELASNSVAGANVIADSLTFSDIAGGSSTGSVSITAGYVPNGRCRGFNIAISGNAVAGDTVVMSVRGTVQDGVFWYGTRVTSATNATALLCNFSGTTQQVITDLPIRLLTFR